MSFEYVNAWQAFGLLGIAAILIPLLIVGISDLLAAWSFLNFLERWKDK